jgi:hypothetical protein
MDSQRQNGRLHSITTLFSGHFDADAVVVTICSALTQYNAIELLLLIFTTFRKYSGLYFYSLLVASVGLIPYTWGYLIEFFQLCDQIAGLVVSSVGWPAMVTGQSLVLFSRLRILLLPDHSRLHQALKWMIIIDGTVFHVTTTVVLFGAFLYSKGDGFILAYRYVEKIQMTGFTIQELILSAVYVWRTTDILRGTAIVENGRQRQGKRVMIELLAINVLIIAMDIALLVVEYQNRHPIEQALKGVIYSVKLKLEFAVLNKLVAISGGRRQDTGGQNLEFVTSWDTTGEHSRRPTADSARQFSKSMKEGDAIYLERVGSSGRDYSERLQSLE